MARATYLEAGQIFSCVFVLTEARLLLVHVDRIPVFSAGAALRMREMYETRDWTFDELANHFEVNNHLVNEVIQGTWHGIRQLGLPWIRHAPSGSRTNRGFKRRRSSPAIGTPS